MVKTRMVSLLIWWTWEEIDVFGRREESWVV
jgi:hypothetical protein